MNYYVIPETLDGCESPTTPEPMPLAAVSEHIAQWINRYHIQGYFSNCRQIRLRLDEMKFRLEPDVADCRKEEDSQKAQAWQ